MFRLPVKNKILYRRHALVMIQSTVRMFLAVRKHRPRYKGLAQVKLLQDELRQMMQIGTYCYTNLLAVSVSTEESCLAEYLHCYDWLTILS